MKRFITKIEYVEGQRARVFLDDGSELCGLSSVDTHSQVRANPDFRIAGMVWKPKDIESMVGNGTKA